MKAHFFQDLSKSAFFLPYGALVRQGLEYSLAAYSPNLVADISRSGAYKKIGSRLALFMFPGNGDCSGFGIVLTRNYCFKY